MPRYSIIVPVYNTEQYLAQCVESVLNQEGDFSFELILIDNGSQDSAGAMCDTYAVEDPRVRVIHQENRRPGGGRNAGLRIAEGEYVIFVDSDDWWEPNLLATVDGLLVDKPDIATFDYYRHLITGKTKTEQLAKVLPAGESGMVWLDQIFALETSLEHAPWGYVYRMDFLRKNQLEFRTDLSGPEDFDFNMRTIPLAASVVGTRVPLYNFRIREGSVMRTFSYQTFLDVERSYAEAFRRIPHYGMANYYAAGILGITRFSSREAREAVERIRKNLDILENVTSRRKLLLPLMRFFGVYRGAKIYRTLQKVKSGLFKKEE